MANIIIKNNEGTQVIAKDVDMIKLPTTNGGTATFRQWNGAESSVPKATYKKMNVMRASGYVLSEPTVTIKKGE